MEINDGTYKGEYSGCKQGNGICCLINGKWMDDVYPNGYGTFYYKETIDKFYTPKEYKYEGFWLMGQRHGKGRFFLNDGSNFEREYCMGKRINLNKANNCHT